MSIAIASQRPLGPPPSTSATPTVLPIVQVRWQPVSASWPLILVAFLAGSAGNVAVFVAFVRQDPLTAMSTFSALGLGVCAMTRRPALGAGFLAGTVGAIFMGVYLFVQAWNGWTF